MQSSNDMIRSGLKDAVDKAFKQNGTFEVAPPLERRQIATDIVNEAAPIILNQTNNEPWYQSRVTLGSIATIVSSLFALWALITAGITDGELYAPPIVAIIGACTALYGRWAARKPIGA